MSKRLGKQTVALGSNVSILSFATVAGRKEGEGPLASYFDTIMEEATWGEQSWEKAESKMQKTAVQNAVQNAGLILGDINYILAGDLLNQCIGSSFGLRELGIPFLGLYGACSTMAEGLSLASMLIDGEFAQKAAAVTSSHFCTAERQYRNPLEYGGQRPPTAQWTVTGAGALVLSEGGKGPYVTHITTGKIVDMGVKDANNMGGAMAPAAVSTLEAHFNDTGRAPDFYDLIVTGDLGFVGRDIAAELLGEDGYDMSKNYNDCGCMIFERQKQDAHAGGSGCGCSASVLCGYIMKEMMKGTFCNVLFAATGALMSPTTLLQGDSIPSIAHAVAISANSPKS